MADFHQKPFDEGTLTKLDIFQLYTREWLPVFLANEEPIWREIHIFDFFCGPGEDANGAPGSPLRILNVLEEFRKQSLPGWAKVKIKVHFFDSDARKIALLEKKIKAANAVSPGIEIDLKPIQFKRALGDYSSILNSRNSAKLLFIDQYGVDEVDGDVFRSLVTFPTSDFLFFISSSTLHRFRDHPSIKQKIDRPDDSYHVHRAVLDHYRGHLPSPERFFLAPFSIKKGPNVYGLIFGSGHLRGVDKFLEVAWKKDWVNGEANFDIGHDNIYKNERLLDLELFTPSKVVGFERDLESSILSGACGNELDIIKICITHGVRRQHAKSVLSRLKKEKKIKIDFDVPDIRRIKSPRLIQRE